MKIKQVIAFLVAITALTQPVQADQYYISDYFVKKIGISYNDPEQVSTEKVDLKAKKVFAKQYAQKTTYDGKNGSFSLGPMICGYVHKEANFFEKIQYYITKDPFDICLDSGCLAPAGKYTYKCHRGVFFHVGLNSEQVQAMQCEHARNELVRLDSLSLENMSENITYKFMKTVMIENCK